LGLQAYAFEELVAEMGAAFLAAKLDLKGEMRHASYIDSWVKILKEDNRALLKAASQAQRAFEYLYALVASATEHTEVVPKASEPTPKAPKVVKLKRKQRLIYRRTRQRPITVHPNQGKLHF
jgi:hypothetical protein